MQCGLSLMDAGVHDGMMRLIVVMSEHIGALVSQLLFPPCLEGVIHIIQSLKVTPCLCAASSRPCVFHCLIVVSFLPLPVV